MKRNHLWHCAFFSNPPLLNNLRFCMNRKIIWLTEQLTVQRWHVGLQKGQKKKQIRDEVVHVCVLFPATQVAPKVLVRLLLFILVTSPALAGLLHQLRVSLLSGCLTCTPIPPSRSLTGAKQQKDSEDSSWSASDLLKRSGAERKHSWWVPYLFFHLTDPLILW